MKSFKASTYNKKETNVNAYILDMVLFYKIYDECMNYVGQTLRYSPEWGEY